MTSFTMLTIFVVVVGVLVVNFVGLLLIAVAAKIADWIGVK